MKFKWLSILLSGIFVIAALAYLNIILPTSSVHGASFDNNSVRDYPCGSDTVKLIISENPSCPNGSIGSMASFQSTGVFELENSSAHSNVTVNWVWDKNFCANESGGACNNRVGQASGSFSVAKIDCSSQANQQNPPPQCVSSTTGTMAPPSPFSACGFYQNDLSFTITTPTGQQCTYGSMSNPTNNNANFSYCHTGVTCVAPPATHLACQGSACVSVPGAGGNQCTTSPNSCLPQQHLACQSNACVEVSGAGTDQCTTNPNSCLPQTHLACQDNACVSVPGAGSDQCTTNPNSCLPQQHLACRNNACTEVPGAGSDQCTTNPNSCAEQTHLACRNMACIIVPGSGDNSCLQNSDCRHLACQNNACVQVAGHGSNQCTTNPDSCIPVTPSPTPELTVVKVVNNNHGGTKGPADFVLRVNSTQVTSGAHNAETPGDYVVSEDTMSGYHQVSISGDCDATGHVHLSNGDNKTCVIENEDNGSNTCTMPTCNTTISGCSYPFPDTTSCSCGPLVCITQTPSQPNITNIVNVTQSQSQQQQQQQAVLGASVAPASNATSLPSTGAETEVMFGLIGLLPLGFKLRKFV